jgi:hypothetical protein
MTLKEQLIREIEQAPEESVVKFMQVWQIVKQSAFNRGAEDWDETLFVLQNIDLMEQVSRSMATHEQHQGYQPSKEKLN